MNPKNKGKKRFWQLCLRADGRVEYTCPHNVGHGWHPHGCDGCCNRDDFPLHGKNPEDVYNIKNKRGKQLINEIYNTWEKQVKNIRPIIECPFKGCTGNIDLTYEMQEICAYSTDKRGTYKEPYRVIWLIGTLMCPKCKNAVGLIEIRPSAWSELGKQKLEIRNPKTGKHITIKNTKTALNKYLKPWSK